MGERTGRRGLGAEVSRTREDELKRSTQQGESGCWGSLGESGELGAVGTHTRAWGEGRGEHYGPVTGEAGSCLSHVLLRRGGLALAKAEMEKGNDPSLPSGQCGLSGRRKHTSM